MPDFPRANDISRRVPVVLAIAGFDPSGGAGLIADIKTLAALGCTPVAAITSLTFQNSYGMRGAIHQTAQSLRLQLLPVIEALEIDAIKIGMLPTREIVLEVSRLILEKKLSAPVVDPVMHSSSGFELMNAEAVAALLTELMPLTELITPNIPEAEALTGMTIADENAMRLAAGKLREMGARAVLVKGGHLKEQRSEVGDQGSEVKGRRSELRQAVDILDNEGAVTVFRSDWIDGPPARGTGCMLSSAIAAGLAQRLKLEDAIRAARNFVARAIRDASELET